MINTWLYVIVGILVFCLILVVLYQPAYCFYKGYMRGNSVVMDKCHVIEFNEPPDDTDGPLTENEHTQLQSTQREGFRGGGRGGRGGWRGWPSSYWRRPWRSSYWSGYPNYVYTYPLTYYTPNWLPPVQRYVVRLGVKTATNPFVNQGYSKGYLMNGVSGGYLNLTRGQTYEFDVFTSKDDGTDSEENEPFFFTTKPEGGNNNNSVFNFSPVVNGVVRITITNDTPSQFYYASTNHKYVGGNVFVN